ncbi:MAG TPA: M56 family metallopeptidase [Propionibacteriaceae bacterium]
MIAPALLIAYVIIMGSIGARGLQSARWPQRSPWLGMLAWQALSASVLLAALLTGVTLAGPTLSISTRLASLLDACWEAIWEQYSTPGGATAASVGVLLVIAILGRLGFTLALEVLTTHCRRRTQRRRLMMVASRDPTMGVFVVPHPSSAVYCLPGRPGVVVCTSAAAAALDGPEMAAVLAHERAHLRSRHDMVLTAAAGLRAAFPFVPAFTLARAELGRLVEMQADDAAAAAGERRVLASALVRLAAGAVPAVAMGAGGTTALARVQRLARPANPLTRPGSVLAAAMALTAVLLPLLIAVGPALVAVVLDYCPPGLLPPGH